MLIALLHPGALAGIPVVYDGEAAAAIERTAQRTGLPADQLDGVALRELLDSPPQALGQAVMRHCAGELTDMSAVRAELVRAEAAWSRGEAGEAMDHADLGVTAAGCLRELAEAATLARLFLLRGALAAEGGDAEQARAELSSALAFEPELTWVDTFPAAGAAELAELRLEPPGLALTLVPGGGSGGPWLDSRPVADRGEQRSIRAGLHLAQATGSGGIRSAWLVVEGEATLVLPGSYRQPVLEQLADLDTRGEVEALLQATLPDFQAAYVTSGGGLWLVTAADGAVQTTELLPLEEPEEEERAPPRRTWWRKRRLASSPRG